jgi:excisionase family DNA binding protein
MEKRLVSIGEAAQFLGVSTSFLYHKVCAGQMKHVRIGRAIRFDLKALERFIDENTHGERDFRESLGKGRR